MAKKYLSIEEAAEVLGVGTNELTKIREAGELRGYADRGTWKFKGEDIEEFARSRQADSSDSVGLDDDQLPVADEDFGDATSILDDDEDVAADGPTMLQSSLDDNDELMLEATSDSDVRLVLDDSLAINTGEVLPASEEAGEAEETAFPDSDSDVRLVAEPPLEAGNEDDVKLINLDSASDVQLTTGPPEESPLEDEAGSESDVKLVQSDAGPPPPPVEDGALAKTAIEDAREVPDLALTDVADGSGVSLEPAPDSDYSLQGIAESGIDLEDADESGIALEAADESGISLEAADESGIALESIESGVVLDGGTLADSGLALADDVESGIALEEAGSAFAEAENVDETQLEVPVIVEDATDFEMEEDEATGTDTSVLLFDDEEDADDYSATVVKKSEDVDMFDEFGDLGDDDDDDLDIVDDDIFGEDDEVEDLDVFDADDEVFGDEDDDAVYEVAEQRVAVAVEYEWGLGAFLPLAASTLLMIGCGMVMFELVRSIWGAQDPGFSAGLIETFAGMFGES